MPRLIDVPMIRNDAGAATVGEYLEKLLLRLWEEAEGFSGKRPFGNSDWQFEVYASLIKAGYEIGSLDEDDFVDFLDCVKADKLITDAIAAVFKAEPVKHGRWVVNPESYDGFKHHMCSNCKNDAIFDYVYEADFDEMLDGEWDYVGQRESGISEHLTKRCPNCDAKMDVTDTNVGDLQEED